MQNVKKLAACLAIGLSCAISAHAQTAMQDLAHSKNCFSCHAVAKKVVGPSFNDVASRYAGASEAVLAKKIIKGGSGTWGPVPMPANLKVSESEAQQLAHWILTGLGPN